MSSPTPPTEPTNTDTAAPPQTPPNTQQDEEEKVATNPSQSPSTLTELDLLPHLKTWLTTTHPKIQNFWIGATWRLWARYELYLHLDNALSSTCLIYHGIDEIWAPRTEQVDIHIEPSDDQLKQVAIILRCEKVNENEGSFERFRAEMDGDIERVKLLGPVGAWFEGMRVLVVGISGPLPPENEETVWRCQPEPERVEVREGEVNMWVYEMVLPGRENVERNGVSA